MGNQLLDLAAKISRARKSAKLTQAELADKIGVTQQRVAYIETGKCNLSLKSLHRIAKATGTKLKFDYITKED